MSANSVIDNKQMETVRCGSCKIADGFPTLSDDKLYKWQMAYVALHESRGHKGYCYAWLDTALCPLLEISGRCLYSHEFPSNWSEEMKLCHREKKFYIDSLLTDDSESDSSSVDEDCTDSEEEIYDLELPANLIPHLYENPTSDSIHLQHPIVQQIDSLLNIPTKTISEIVLEIDSQKDSKKLNDNIKHDNNISHTKPTEIQNKCIISRINRKRLCDNSFDLFENSTKMNVNCNNNNNNNSHKNSNTATIRRSGLTVQSVIHHSTSEDKGGGGTRNTTS